MGDNTVMNIILHLKFLDVCHCHKVVDAKLVPINFGHVEVS